ncbi:MAG: hypothetical protein WC725_01920 [Patescibacteria group bacterium]|jgi:hypothetical protein
MDKTTIFVTDESLNNKILKDLEGTIAGNGEVKIYFKSRLYYIDIIKGYFNYKWFGIKHFFKFRLNDLIRGRNEPMLGGGGYFSIESWIGPGIYFFTVFVLPNIGWEITKLVVVKSYKYLQSKNREFIVLANTISGPFEPSLRILIPNDLTEDGLSSVLDDAGQLFDNFSLIKYKFRYKKIELKYTDRWKLKFIGAF